MGACSGAARFYVSAEAGDESSRLPWCLESGQLLAALEAIENPDRLIVNGPEMELVATRQAKGKGVRPTLALAEHVRRSVLPDKSKHDRINHRVSQRQNIVSMVVEPSPQRRWFGPVHPNHRCSLYDS